MCQYSSTKKSLGRIDQKGIKMPDGPLLMSREGYASAVINEIMYKPEYRSNDTCLFARLVLFLCRQGCISVHLVNYRRHTGYSIVLQSILYVKFLVDILNLNAFMHNIFVETCVFAVENSPHVVGIPSAALHAACTVKVEPRQCYDCVCFELNRIYLCNGFGQ